MRSSDWIELLRGGRAIFTAVLLLGIGLHAIDVFIIVTVMPTVVDDIGGAAFYTWPTMLYMVASIIGAASGGPLKAALGARKGYSLAGIVFLAGSLGCAVSPNMAVLLAARVVQGTGGGLLVAQSMALVRELYPAELRTRVLALISGVWGIAALVGPVFGGGFAEIGWWRGAFWTSAAIILMFTALAWHALPATGPAASIPRFPVRRLALLGAGVLCVGFTGTIRGPGLQLGLVAAAVLMVGGTFRLDAGAANPLFPSRPLSLRSPVGTAYWMFFLQSGTHTTIGLFLPLVLQVLHGASPLMAATANGVLALSWTVSSFATSGWRGRAEPAALVGGPVLTTMGLVGLAFWITSAPLEVIALLVAMVGLGIGMCNLHLTAWAMALAAEGEESITASSIPTIRSLGIAFASAGAGLVANSVGLEHGISAEAVAGTATWVSTAAAVLPATVTLLALRLLGLRRRRPARLAASLAGPDAGPGVTGRRRTGKDMMS